MASKAPPFKIPKTLRIRGKRFLVHREADYPRGSPQRKVLTEALDGNLGICYDSTRLRQIILREHSSASAEAVTFVHELLHACSPGNVPDRAEEVFIRSVERSLYNALAQMDWTPAIWAAAFARVRTPTRRKPRKRKSR